MSINKIGASLLIVGLIIGVATGYGITYTVYRPQISQLESNISQKDTQITQLQADLTEAQNNITTLQGDLSSLQGDVTSLLGQINALNSTVLSLQTQLEEAQAEIMPGRVPILHVGDWWTMETLVDGTTYTLTTNVVGEDTEHYIMFSSYDPPFQGQINSTDWIDKSTFNPVRMWGHGNYTYDTTIIPYTSNMTTLYTYEGGVPYPMIVGKELNLTETITYNMTMMGTTYTYLMNYSLTVNVEAIENVVVPAGTFTCFRMEMRNATSGDPFYTVWYSDEVKYYVKYVDYSTTPETTYELTDYV